MSETCIIIGTRPEVIKMSHVVRAAGELGLFCDSYRAALLAPHGSGVLWAAWAAGREI